MQHLPQGIRNPALPRAARPASALAWALCGAALLPLAACGGGGGTGASAAPADPGGPPPLSAPGAPAAPSPSTPPPPAGGGLPLGPATARTGPVPAGAERVDPSEFAERLAAGRIGLTRPGRSAEQERDERLRQVVDDRAQLQNLAGTEDSPQLRSLLAALADPVTALAAPVLSLPGGQRITNLSAADRARQWLLEREAALDPARQWARYRQDLALLDARDQDGLPTAASLEGRPLAELVEARRRLAERLQGLPVPEGARLEADAQAWTPPTIPPDRATPSSLPRVGTAPAAPNCNLTGLHRSFWYPLKTFQPQMRSQGQRGVCWAFAAIDAIETRERVQTGVAGFDRSVQFLVNKVKREWLPSDTVEGGSAPEALNAAVQRGFGLPSAEAWRYNPAALRSDAAAMPPRLGARSQFEEDCQPGVAGGYDGTCSASVHQSQEVCTTVQGLTHCAYATMTAPQTGTVAASRVHAPLWRAGERFDRALVERHLAAGRVVIASFPVYPGIDAAANGGYVSDYGTVTSRGGHVANLVGFISNEAMTLPGQAPATFGGGGLFILKNSWGCAGDGGYWYVPADYVEGRFDSLSVIDDGPARSALWQREQVDPGSTGELSIRTDGGGLTTVPQNVASDLGPALRVSHPAATYVRLTVRSDLDGTVYDGQWRVEGRNTGLFGANQLRVRLPTAGVHTLMATARNGSQQASTRWTVRSENEAPTVAFEPFAPPREGDTALVSVRVADRNESQPGTLCATTEWIVSAPDQANPARGCNSSIRFGAAGPRLLTVRTTDSGGLSRTVGQPVAVGVPAVNPYPRISGRGVFARDFQASTGNLVGLGCRTVGLAGGATADLGASAPPLCGGVLTPDLPRHFSEVSVDNPLGETLAYRWRLTVQVPGQAPATIEDTTATPRWNLPTPVFPGIAGETPAWSCRVGVSVIAPDPARTRPDDTVWSGACIGRFIGPR